MTSQIPESRIVSIIAGIRAGLDSIGGPSPTTPSELRREVQALVEIRRGLRELSKHRLARLDARDAGRDRILAYLRLFPGVIISAEELQIVGGIQETARRIRELRVEFGYSIITGNSRDDLRPDQYVLESLEPDEGEAAKWRIANTIRRRKGGSVRDRWLELLKANLGKPVTAEQLAYVAPSKDRRRLRELRTECGWRVVTKQSGRPELPSGAYLLESAEQLPVHDRKIPDEVYENVFERDRGRCRKCSWTPADFQAGSKRRFLEVHHVEHYRDGGTSNRENLVTLCNLHHDSVHRAELDPDRFWTWLAEATDGPSDAH